MFRLALTSIPVGVLLDRIDYKSIVIIALAIGGLLTLATAFAALLLLY